MTTACRNAEWCMSEEFIMLSSLLSKIERETEKSLLSQNLTHRRSSRLLTGTQAFCTTTRKGALPTRFIGGHYFKHIVEKNNSIYKIQMPDITPHVCRHTYCSNMAKSGMNPKTLQYLMGHADIGTTLNVYTHVNFEDAKAQIEKLNIVKN